MDQALAAGLNQNILHLEPYFF